MNESESSAQESADTTEESTADPIEMFVSSVTEALDECGADDEMIASVEATGEQLAKRVREDRDGGDQ